MSGELQKDLHDFALGNTVSLIISTEDQNQDSFASLPHLITDLHSLKISVYLYIPSSRISSVIRWILTSNCLTEMPITSLTNNKLL